MFLYEIIQDRFVRPRIHKADPRRHREILRNSLKGLQGSRILDLGCGTGAAIPLIDRSNAYTGLDLSYAMLKLAARKAARHGFRSFDLVQGNAEELLFDDASFDLVLMDTALHMIPRYQRAITEAARVMRETGVFVCSTPTVGLHRGFDVQWEKISGKRDLHSLSEDDIKTTCSQAGLDFQRIDQNGGVLYFQAIKRP